MMQRYQAVELQKLAYFLAAARTENFRRAAELCNVAQPVLSRQIAALEHELGVALFRRERKRVILTDAGHEFATYARAALEQIQLGQQAMAAHRDGERGNIQIGCIEPLATGLLSPALARFTRRHPGVRIHVTVSGTEELLSVVERGDLAFGLFGLTSERDVPTEVLMVQELFSDTLRAVVSRLHPLAQRDAPVQLADLAAEPLVLLRDGYQIRRLLDRAFAAQGRVLDPIVEVDLVAALTEYVRQGIGLTVLPSSLVTNPELAALPITDLRDAFRYVLVQRRDGALEPAARALVAELLHNYPSAQK